MKNLVFPFLLFIIPIISNAQQDFNLLFSDELTYRFQGIEASNDTLYLIGRFRNQELFQGMKIIKMDTTGKIIKKLEVIDTTQVFTTYYYYTGFAIKDDKIYFWGTTVPEDRCYLLIVNKDLSFHTIKFYENFDPNYKHIGNKNFLIRQKDIFLLTEVQSKDTYGTNNAMIIRTDSNGKEIWRKSYGELGQEDYPICIVEKSKNELIVGGWRTYPKANLFFPVSQKWGHNWMFAIDTLGKVLWEWEEKGAQSHAGVNSLHLIDDNYYFTSGLVWYKSSGLDAQGYVRCINSKFEDQWRHTVPNESTISKLNAVTMTILKDSSHFVATGYNYDGFPAPHIKLTLDGKLVYYRLDSICADEIGVPDVGYIYLSDITSLSSGSTVACGAAEVLTPAGWTNRGWVIKVNAQGKPDTLACGTWLPAEEPVFMFENNLSVFPNPASDYLKISLGENFSDWEAHFEVYSLLGELKKRVILPKNSEIFELDISDLMTGSYVGRFFRKNGQSVFIKFIVVDR